MKQERIPVGTRVSLSKRSSEWTLQHADVYFKSDGEQDSAFDDAMRMCLAHQMGEELTGTVIGYGSIDDEFPGRLRVPFHRVRFEMGPWRMEHYFSLKDLTVCT